jgi:hypothetical protein
MAIMAISGVTSNAGTYPTLQANSARGAASNLTTQQPSTEKRAHGDHGGHHASATLPSGTTASTSSSTASVTSQSSLSATASNGSTPTYTLNGVALGRQHQHDRVTVRSPLGGLRNERVSRLL